MWKEDRTAGFFGHKESKDYGFLWRKTHVTVSYSFACKDTGWPERCTLEQLEKIREHAQDLPDGVARFNGWTWWMYNGRFFKENDARTYTREEAKAMILQMLRRQERAVKRAISEVDDPIVNGNRRSSSREPISEEVKAIVWRRDGGQCVRCGSNEKLEFDHIIPLSKGGSNTARNLQLLCERCNRSKGAADESFPPVVDELD